MSEFAFGFHHSNRMPCQVVTDKSSFWFRKGHLKENSIVNWSGFYARSRSCATKNSPLHHENGVWGWFIAADLHSLDGVEWNSSGSQRGGHGQIRNDFVSDSSSIAACRDAFFGSDPDGEQHRGGERQADVDSVVDE